MEEKRVRYVNPIKYLVYVSALVFFLSSFLPIQYQVFRSTQGFAYQQYNWFQRLLHDNPIILYLFTSLFAAYYIRILYPHPRTSFNKTEINTVVMYILGQIFLMFFILSLVVNLVMEKVMLRLDESVFVIAMPAMILVIFALFLGYLTYASKTLFPQSSLLAGIRSFILMLLAAATYNLSRFLVLSL